MPNVVQPSGQDWGDVKVGKHSGPLRKAPKSASGVSMMKAAGLLKTEKRHAAGGNASAHSGGTINARKLEESDETKHAKVDKSLSKALMQARMAKKMTQKELATAINEKPQVIGEYESGKAIPNAQIISKMERKLGCKLPRPGKKPAGPKSGGASKTGSAKPSGRSTVGGPAKRR